MGWFEIGLYTALVIGIGIVMFATGRALACMFAGATCANTDQRNDTGEHVRRPR